MCVVYNLLDTEQLHLRRYKFYEISDNRVEIIYRNSLLVQVYNIYLYIIHNKYPSFLNRSSSFSEIFVQQSLFILIKKARFQTSD